MANPPRSDRGGDGRFQPGRSGNPAGRPSKSRTASEAIRKALDRKVDVNENGKRKRMSKRDAAATHIANKSASGDLRAAKLGFDLAAKAETSESAATPTPDELNATDQAIFERLLERLERITLEKLQK